MEIIGYDALANMSKEITLKALEHGLIPVDASDMSQTAHNIAAFYDEISNALYNLGD